MRFSDRKRIIFLHFNVPVCCDWWSEICSSWNWSGKLRLIQMQRLTKRKRSQYCVGPPLTLIKAHISCGIVPVNLCNVSRFISIPHWIFVFSKLLLLWWESLAMVQRFLQNITKILFGQSPWSLALSSWNIPVWSGRKTSTDGRTWSFSVFMTS